MRKSPLHFLPGLLAMLSLAGCAGLGGHSPTVDVLGSYFPAWMISILCGLVLTLVTRLALIAVKVEKCLRPSIIIYPCLVAVFTLTTWLTLFQN